MIALTVAWGALGLSASLEAQEPTSFLEKLVADERDRERALETERLRLQPFTLEFGGWYRYSYFWWEEPGGDVVMSNDVSLRNHDIRFWLSVNLEDIHYAYARSRLGFIDFSTGDSFDHNDVDTEGINLDMGFYRFNLTEALRKYCEAELPVTVQVQAGRQYFNVGTGLAYSQIHDGVQLMLGAPLWKFTAFLADSIRSEDDVDRSIPESDNSRRFFSGGQFTWTGLDQHEPYVFWLLQRSHHRDKDFFQDYDYNSNYVGFGSHGQFVLPGLRYYTEFIWECGSSSPTGVFAGHEQIDAFAFDSGLDYYFDCKTHPRVGVEYAFGSGDQDRQSPTNTIGGNLPGTDDGNFIYFGYINTGYALSARLSNLQFLRLGGSLRPFEGHPYLDRLEIGSNFFWFWKDEANGGISDFRADRNSEDVGNELDIFLHWQILSDLALSIRFGTFYPGNAYSHDSNRTFFWTAATYSF
jgi:hypothetical protein